jgi:hypothetical protein
MVMNLFKKLVLSVAAAAFASAAWAADPPKVDAAVAKQSEAIASLETAARLTTYGRGELEESTGLKGYKSPEALVAAAGIYLRAHAVLGKLDAINEKGEVDASAKVVTLEDKANALIDEAEAMVAGDKAKADALKALIAQAKKVNATESRGAVGRPRTITRVLAPGQSDTITLNFVPNQPATINYTTVGGPRQRCEIINPQGVTIYDNTAASGGHNWHTANANNVRAITIRLTNNGNKTHTVTVTTN